MNLKDSIAEYYKKNKDTIIKGALLCSLLVAIAKIIYDAMKKD